MKSFWRFAWAMMLALFLRWKLAKFDVAIVAEYHVAFKIAAICCDWWVALEAVALLAQRRWFRGAIRGGAAAGWAFGTCSDR